MSFLKLVVSFAPWIIIAKDTMHRVEIGLVFCTAATVAVLSFHSLWAIGHLTAAWLLMTRVLLPEWACHTMSYAALVGVAACTSWYPGYLRKGAGSAQASTCPW
ncbi:hypothetical protein CIW52_30950 [Mycolicibacterium sp. P9-64]|uniref:hypothetical protein n=1 Tax=Mycolicibacterium sp. P9-64 TaxID=2024612 RepID=UPI0011F04980|nr:hypothetical protein [Mycolicibacterium sp. P9-64]KAA0077342.1 hypothetical protein CIW52_30950 [Mycolicibacterium sp. P9-64]